MNIAMEYAKYAEMLYFEGINALEAIRIAKQEYLKSTQQMK